MKGKDYIPNGGIKEFNQAVEEHWQFYMNTCYDPDLFFRIFPNRLYCAYFSPRDIMQLYQMANLPDKTLIDIFQYPKTTIFNHFRNIFTKFINKEGNLHEKDYD